MLWRRAVVAASLGAALALSACTVPGTPQQSPAVTTPVPAGGVNGRAADQLAEGGLLRLAISAAPTQWNPFSTAGGTTSADVLRGPLSGQAFLFDASGTPRPNPDYLVSATASGSPTVVTLRLNPLAVWGDGVAITAADWVATFKAYRAAQERHTARSLAGWERVAGVRQGADDHEVVVTFTGDVPDWTEPLVELPARASSVADAATFDHGWSDYRADWFAGPYVVAHVDQVQQLWTLEPNPRWWGTTPRLDRIFVRIVSPDALASTVAAGEFDLYSPGREDALLALARTAPDSAVRTAPGTSGRSLTLSLEGPLADRKLCQAIVRGIDRAKLARAALRSAEPNPTLWSNHLMLPQQAGYLDASTATGLDYDARAAAQALTDAGWPLVGGVRTGASGALTLTVGVRTGDARAEAEASSIAADLTALGITVRTVSSGADLTPVSVAVPRYPLRGVAGRFASVPGLAELVVGMDSNLDASARLGQATQAARLLWQDARTLPLYVEPDVVVVRTRLANLGASGYASTTWADVGFTS